MTVTGLWQVAGMGMLGVVLIELVKFIRWMYTKDIGERIGDPLYWAGFLAYVIVGGAVAALNGIESVPVMRAIQLGIAAPAVISGFATGASKEGVRPSGRVAPENEADFVGGRAPQKPSFGKRLAGALSW